MRPDSQLPVAGKVERHTPARCARFGHVWVVWEGGSCGSRRRKTCHVGREKSKALRVPIDRDALR